MLFQRVFLDHKLKNINFSYPRNFQLKCFRINLLCIQSASRKPGYQYHLSSIMIILSQFKKDAWEKNNLNNQWMHCEFSTQRKSEYLPLMTLLFVLYHIDNIFMLRIHNSCKNDTEKQKVTATGKIQKRNEKPLCK